MTDLKIKSIAGVSGSVDRATVTVHAILSDGQPVQIALPTLEAGALVQALHQATTKIADRAASGPLAKEQVQLFDCRTVHMGHDHPTKVAAVIFDKGLPSQAGYKLPEAQFWQLAQGVNTTAQVLFGTPPSRKH